MNDRHSFPGARTESGLSISPAFAAALSARPGDLVGVAALSGPGDPERLDRGLEALAALGFRVAEAPNLRSRHGLFAGDEASRLAGFHQLLADEEVRAIFFMRGGHGVLRLLPHIDWVALARARKTFVGYSDLTPLLLEVVSRSGCAALHGPLVAGELAAGLTVEESASLMDNLAGRHDCVLACNVAGGDAEGPLLGGCLTMLAATAGTPFQHRFAGAILLLEDVNEPPYRVDRMLTQLELAGMTPGVKGIVAGYVSADAASPAGCGATLQVLREHAGRLGVPLAVGLPVGHARPNYTLALGARCTISQSQQAFRIDAARHSDNASPPG